MSERSAATERSAHLEIHILIRAFHAPSRGTTSHENRGCDPEPTSTARSQGITHVLVLVVVLGRFFVEDEDKHKDEDNFQERPC